MVAYFNEIDPFAAQWLRNLIRAGHIADGEVDERSIVDVRADDLRGFAQCHFFAGIGVWSYALRQAGFPDDRPVWTGSCPCQPFSAAGKGDEFADERHLWPAWFALIRECGPVAVFGEQVASKDALAWLDHVCADLEGEGYAVGAVDTCAAGYGSPHIRQRLYWVAESQCGAGWERGREHREVVSASGNEGAGRNQPASAAAYSGAASAVADAASAGAAGGFGIESSARNARRTESTSGGATNGFWSGAEWIACRDGKARPTGRGISPLVIANRTVGDAAMQRRSRTTDTGREAQRGLEYADGIHGPGPVESCPESLAGRLAEGVGRGGDRGAPSPEIDADNSAEGRVMRLRGYGNSLVAPQAAEFVRAAMSVIA
jgi:DNA (cytosine-5)-methyltransferase 1